MFYSITVTFIFTIIVTPKITYSYSYLLLITYSYWFIIIFFMVKKVPSIGNYPSLTASFSFFSLEISFISITVVSSISFFDRKRFLASLTAVSFISFFSLKETPKQLFFSECCKIFNNSFFIEHLQ